MKKFKYYFPFIFLSVGLLIFVHFVWIPNSVLEEKKELLEYEQQHIKLLGETLHSALLTGDIAYINNILTKVKKSHPALNIELYKDDNLRLFPVFDEDLKPQTDYPYKEEILLDQQELGYFIYDIDIDILLERYLHQTGHLEFALFSAFILLGIMGMIMQYFWLNLPITRLEKVTHDISHGNYDAELDGNVGAIFEDFVKSFCDMRRMLKQREETIRHNKIILQTVQTIQQLYFTNQDNTFTVFNRILGEILTLTKSEFGFVGEIINRDNTTSLKMLAISNIAWDLESRRVYEKSIEGGFTLSNLESLYGSAIVTGRTVISNDPANDPRSSGLPPGHPEMKSFLAIPLYNRRTELVGLIGIANGKDPYTEELIEELGSLWLAVSNLIDAYRQKLALVESEQNLRAIFNTAIEGIVTINNRGIIASFNQAAENIFGYSAKEAIGQNISMLMPEEFSRNHDKYLNTYFGGRRSTIVGTERELLGRRRNGDIFPIEISVSEIKGSETHFTGIIRDITERKLREREIDETRKKLAEANQRLNKLVRIDGLTNISNRRSFDEHLDHEFKRATRNSLPISLILFDIDHFKLYNDFYGHSAGDECLKKVARATQSMFQRTGDMVARYGGEEFVIVLPNTDIDVASSLADVLLQKIRDLNIEHQKSTTTDHVTISIGVSCNTIRDPQSPTELIELADQALYTAKENGRNQAMAQPLQPETTSK